MREVATRTDFMLTDIECGLGGVIMGCRAV
jgi:hypothetical protein